MENNFDHIQVISQPKDLKVNLYRHQLASIYEMEKRENQLFVTDGPTHIETNIGVNADKTGFGKCMGRNTPIIMYDGSIKMVQDIKLGDLLMGDNSSSRKVLSLARGKEQMYKIKQNIGDDYIVNESHILSLTMTCPKKISKTPNRIQAFYFDPDKIMFRSKSFNYSNYENDKDLSMSEAKKYLDSLPKIDTRVDICIKDYLKLSKTTQKDLKGYKSQVDCWENKLEQYDLDPYFIGLWLGDGSARSPEITTIDKEILEYLKTSFPDFDIKTKKEITHYLSPKINKGKKKSNRIVNVLRKYNLIGNKHIPENYKINTRENRLKLLAGLIDTDGYYKRGVYEITQKNTQLSEDIKFLCGSLGFRCTTKKVNKSCMYNGEKKTGVYNRISIAGKYIDEIPVLLERKKAKNSPNKDQLCTGINVESLEYDDYYGFTLDGNHRFLLGDFTVTHNTLSMVTLIMRDKMEWELDSPYNFTHTVSLAGGRIKKTTTETYEKVDTTLVLVSQSIINQWYEEILKTPLSVRMVTSKKSIENVMIENYDVILVTPTMYNGLVLKHSQYAWKRFIFDEPGHLKVPGMRKIFAGFIWLVTATPNAIIYKHRKCRSSFMTDIINSAGWYQFSEYFNYLIVKNDENFIKYSYSMPPTEHIYHQCYNPIYKAVRGFVTPRITEMISAGNIAGAIEALGGGETENIAELVKQKKEEELEELETRIKILAIRNKKQQIEKLEVSVKRIKEQLKELDERFNEILLNPCNICLEKITDPVMEPNCQNVFCGKCLLTWLENNNTCPLCRTNVEKNKLIYIGNKTSKREKEKKENKKLTKIDTIIKILKKYPEKQFIVFSSWDQTFIPIRTTLENNNIDYIEVKGAIETRRKNIEKYKSGKIRVIFLNSKFNGTGINLQESSGIIVYHNMNDETLDQIIGRANRLGRKDPLEVHHLQI
jgi:hypothetical protein